jgi:hypothetical protein
MKPAKGEDSASIGASVLIGEVRQIGAGGSFDSA